MGVLGEGPGWCFCSGSGRSERVKGSISGSKGSALAAISVAGCGSGPGGGGGGGTGFLIHTSLLLTTHAHLPSSAAAEAAEVRLSHGRLPARLAPHRFFITSSVLDLTIVGLDILDDDSTLQVHPPHYLKSCLHPNLDLGNLVYILGQKNKNELTVGEAKVVIATDNLIKLSTDGVIWCPGSPGFDAQGNLAFMVCDPMKLASSAGGLSASSSSSLSRNKDTYMQFGIPIPVIYDWLYQHWKGSLDESSKLKLPFHRLMPVGPKAQDLNPSFAHRCFFKVSEKVNDRVSPALLPDQRSRCGLQLCCSYSTNAIFLHDKEPVADLHCVREQGILTPEICESELVPGANQQKEFTTPVDQRPSCSYNTRMFSHDNEPVAGIPTPEIFESPRLTAGPVQKKEHSPLQLLDINFPRIAPRSIASPLPLKHSESGENNVQHLSVVSSKNALQPEYELPLVGTWEEDHCSEVQSSSCPVGTWEEDHCSEVRSSSSPLEMLGMEYDGCSSGELTMYSAETMESRNIPSPKETKLQQDGRSRCCANYSGWSSERKKNLPRQQTFVVEKKTSSQASIMALRRSHDYCSATVSSIMKKRSNLENQRVTHRTAMHMPPRWNL